jgi:hypothetical protein
MDRCENCCEILEENYCYVCDGLEDKKDQIHVPKYIVKMYLEKDGREIIH